MSASSIKNQDAASESKRMVIDEQEPESGKGASDEVVTMEMSPSKEACAHEPSDLADPAASATNPVSSIEISAPDQAAGPAMRQQQQQQQQRRPHIEQHMAPNGPGPRQRAGASEPKQQDASNRVGASMDQNQENRPVGEPGAGPPSRQNRLVRQMSSQSSKRSQRNELGASSEQDEGQPRANFAGQPLQSVISEQPSQPKQVVESSVPTDRRCRLCWCCCCPCSA